MARFDRFVSRDWEREREGQSLGGSRSAVGEKNKKVRAWEDLGRNTQGETNDICGEGRGFPDEGMSCSKNSCHRCVTVLLLWSAVDA